MACCSRPGMLRRGRVADGAADADIAAGEMLRPGQGFGHQAAMLDQRRAQMQRAPVPDRYRRRSGRRRRCHSRRSCGPDRRPCPRTRAHRGSYRHRRPAPQLLMGLVGHARLAEAGDDVDAVARRIQVAGPAAAPRSLRRRRPARRRRTGCARAAGVAGSSADLEDDLQEIRAVLDEVGPGMPARPRRGRHG